MEAGMFHKVVEYRFAQKVTRLRVNRYLNDPQVKTYLHSDYKIIKQLSESVHQLQTKGAYIVTSCSLPLKVASQK